MNTHTERFELGVTVGRGGEATIRAIKGRTDLVAKVYHTYSEPRAEKLRYMLHNAPGHVRSPSGHPNLAWPSGLIYSGDETHRVTGFVMPRAAGKPVFEYYGVKSRHLANPHFTWRYLIRTARNLSLILHGLHEVGYIVGDINESNVFVRDTSELSLLDTDSFQVRTTSRILRCEVGTPNFTPPELVGKHLANLDRTANHDAFGLAVLIYLLLMEGFHPFMGRYTGPGDPPSVPEAIGRGLFVGFGLHQYEVPPYSPSLENLGPDLLSLFRQAFSPSGRRPAALDWAGAIAALEAMLTECRKNHNHVYGSHLSECPWCSRTKLLGGRDPFPSDESIKAKTYIPNPHGAAPPPVRPPTGPAPQPARPTFRATPPIAVFTSTRPVVDRALQYAFVALFVAVWLTVVGTFQPVHAVLFVGAAATAGALKGRAEVASASRPSPTPPAWGGTVPRPHQAQSSNPTPAYRPSTAGQSGVVVGSRQRAKYHRPTCEWARKISYRNRITFASAGEATRRGYGPCGTCNP